jgi:hypothetical protein
MRFQFGHFVVDMLVDIDSFELPIVQFLSEPRTRRVC